MLSKDLANPTNIVLVNSKDKKIGVAEKLEAHKRNLKHRAFSVLIFNDKKEFLLQQRHIEKYHSGGLWTNACCSHPFPNEKTKSAAHRRLKEEMGFDTKLTFITKLVYQTPKMENDIFENEVVSIFVGKSNQTIFNYNLTEVQNTKWIAINDFLEDLSTNPDKYSFWLRFYCKIINLENLAKNFNFHQSN